MYWDQAKWLDGALNAEYWGAYAQTELGHGSNVRALETTATYDKASAWCSTHIRPSSPPGASFDI